MDWDKLKSFYEVAISKSISKASAKLNLSQSALSRQIQDLEYDLKTPLFIRHQKGVRLTEQGENLFNTVNQINFSISDFEKKLLDKKTKPVGKLTVSTTVGFGSTNVVSVDRGFLGSTVASHAANAVPQMKGGNYRIEKDVIFFATPPFGQTGPVGVSTQSTFSGRVFSRRDVTRNFVFDDISHK